MLNFDLRHDICPFPLNFHVFALFNNGRHKGANTTYFGQLQLAMAIRRHDFAMEYTATTRAVMDEVLKC